MKRLYSVIPLLILTACTARVPLSPQPMPGLFWQGGDWSVNRFPLDGSFYCSATRGSFGPDFAFNEQSNGVVGWNATDTTGRAAPGVTYPVTLTFVPGGTLRFDAFLQSPTRLASLPADPQTTAALARDIALANSVELRSDVLGDIGHFGLAGASEAMAQLGRCAHGAP